MSLADLDPSAMAPTDRSLVAVARRRVQGRWVVDPWGLDQDLVAVLTSTPVARLAVRVDHAGRAPDGPALVVHPCSVLGAERLSVVVGLGAALGRPVRFLGVPDLALANALGRRFGGVRGHDADLRGLFRQGELVAVPMGPDGVPAHALHAAVATGTPVLPVAVVPPGPLRRSRLVVAEPVATRRRRTARPLEDLQAAVREAFATDL